MDDQWTVTVDETQCISCATEAEALFAAKRVAREHHRSGDVSEIIIPDGNGYQRTAWSCG